VVVGLPARTVSVSCR